MLYYFIILLMGLSACNKKNVVKPEAPPPSEAKIYIEKFQSGEEPKQWEIFTEEQEPTPSVNDNLEKIPEHMDSKPIL